MKNFKSFIKTIPFVVWCIFSFFLIMFFTICYSSLYTKEKRNKSVTSSQTQEIYDFGTAKKYVADQKSLHDEKVLFCNQTIYHLIQSMIFEKDSVFPLTNTVNDQKTYYCSLKNINNIKSEFFTKKKNDTILGISDVHSTKSITWYITRCGVFLAENEHNSEADLKIIEKEYYELLDERLHHL